MTGELKLRILLNGLPLKRVATVFQFWYIWFLHYQLTPLGGSWIFPAMQNGRPRQKKIAHQNIADQENAKQNERSLLEETANQATIGFTFWSCSWKPNPRTRLRGFWPTLVTKKKSTGPPLRKLVLEACFLSLDRLRGVITIMAVFDWSLWIGNGLEFATGWTWG